MVHPITCQACYKLGWANQQKSLVSAPEYVTVSVSGVISSNAVKMSSTYRDLVTAITPAVNLSNVVNIPPSQPCAACARIVPDYSRLELENITTDYELFDTFPEFPVLKASARAGCALCRLLRKTIRSTWGVTMRPMEEDGVGVLSAKDGFWDKLFEKAWDRKVRIFNVRFSILIHQRENNTEGSIRRLLIQFGPVNLPPPEEYDRTRNRPIFQELVFKAFDSKGKVAVNVYPTMRY